MRTTASIDRTPIQTRHHDTQTYLPPADTRRTAVRLRKGYDGTARPRKDGGRRRRRQLPSCDRQRRDVRTGKRNPHGLRSPYRRLFPDLLAHGRPGGNHQPADDSAVGRSGGRRVGRDRKRSRPEQYGNGMGQRLALRLLCVLPGRRRTDQQRFYRRYGDSGRTDL